MARPEFSPEYWYLAFFSDGFRIWKESFFISLNRERGVGERAERERERWGERGGGGEGGERADSHLKGTKQLLVNCHHASSIIVVTAVVGGREQRH